MTEFQKMMAEIIAAAKEPGSAEIITTIINQRIPGWREQAKKGLVDRIAVRAEIKVLVDFLLERKIAVSDTSQLDAFLKSMKK